MKQDDKTQLNNEINDSVAENQVLKSEVNEENESVSNFETQTTEENESVSNSEAKTTEEDTTANSLITETEEKATEYESEEPEGQQPEVSTTNQPVAAVDTKADGLDEKTDSKPVKQPMSWNKKVIILATVSVLVIVALVTGMIFMSKYTNMKRLSDALTNKGNGNYSFEFLKGSIPISKTGKNVVVIMLDRAIGAYVPYIFDELPELNESYQGFTFYPNTISYGQHTNFAAPALYGGYEYTPVELNKRDQELLIDKHNEALKVLPTLFANNGYWATVCDPPYANYKDVPDVSIYDDCEGVNAFNLINYPDDYSVAYDPVANPWLFDNNFAALEDLSKNTLVMNNDQNTFAFIQNDAAHYPKILKTPEYEIPKKGETVSVNLPLNYELNGKVMHMDTESQVGHYHVNVACLKSLGEWFDYLKKNGVYDNTRIIITSDHGFGLYQFDDLWMSNGRDVQFVNPILLVKDFNATGDLKTDNTFMTNADVPTLAVEDIIDNPVNPFTGKEINSDAKTESAPWTTTSDLFYITSNNGTVFDTSDGQWWSVHDDIRVEENWKLEQ